MLIVFYCVSYHFCTKTRLKIHFTKKGPMQHMVLFTMLPIISSTMCVIDAIYGHLLIIWPHCDMSEAISTSVVMFHLKKSQIACPKQRALDSLYNIHILWANNVIISCLGAMLLCSCSFMIHPKPHWTFDKKWSHVARGPNYHTPNDLYKLYMLHTQRTATRWSSSFKMMQLIFLKHFSPYF